MRIPTLNTALALSLTPPKGDSDGDDQGNEQDTDQGNEQGKGQGDTKDQDGQDGQDDAKDGDEKGQGQDKGKNKDGQDKDGQGDIEGDDKPIKYGDPNQDLKPNQGGKQPQDGGEEQDGEGITQDEGYGNTSGGGDGSQGGGAGCLSDEQTDVAQQLADAVAQGIFGTMDRDDAFNDSIVEEQNRADPLQPNEQRYDPFQRNIGENSVEPNQRDNNSVTRILKEVAQQSGQVKVGLVRMIRAMEQTTVAHGTKNGHLSSRMYAQTWSELQGGKRPSRPYYEQSEKMDNSIACSIVVDQSGSMSGLKQQTIKGMLALADALNAVKASVQVIGYRYGGSRGTVGLHYGQGHSQYSYNPTNCGQATIDVFQQFGERFHTVKGRFAHLRAGGGTPTADGMQYALEGLSERNEHHRIMFVLTDGCPDGGHQQIINRQIRLAKEAGIHIVGVGLGGGTQGVVSSYPDSVVAYDMSQLPEALLSKLRQIIKPNTGKRGARVAR